MATGYSIVLTSRSSNALPVLQMLNLLTLALGPFPLLRTDNGTQYKNKRVEDWCAEQGVSHIFSPPYTPQANGCAERTIGKLKTTLGLWKAGRDWGPKLTQACVELNHTPTDSGPSPRELMGLPGISTVVEIANTQSPPLPCVLKLCPGHPSVKLKQRYNITNWNLTWDHNNTIVVLWKSVTSNTLQGYIVNITKGPVLVNQT